MINVREIKVQAIQKMKNSACFCNSWLDHWQTYGTSLNYGCSNISCKNNADMGIHVQKIEHPDEGWYILPVCSHCSSNSVDFTVSEDVCFVPANIRLTCGSRK